MGLLELSARPPIRVGPRIRLGFVVSRFLARGIRRWIDWIVRV